jgi:putative transposase
MIDRKHQLAISRQAKLIEISRGSVYYRPKPVSEEDLALMRQIDELPLGGKSQASPERKVK